MTGTAASLEQWLTGLRVGPDRSSSQVVVTHRPDLIASMIRNQVIDDAATVYVQGEIPAGVGDRVRSGKLMSFTGSVTKDHLYLDNGFELQNRQYGSAEFACFDMPTVLWIESSDDLSAYLRDAHDAWTAGRFAHHITHPNTIVANLAGAGGSGAHAGPADRLYVDVDGAISTSPTGRHLGTAEASGQELSDGWLRANNASAYPDAVCLSSVVTDADRTEALIERPWIARYLVVVAAIRTVRGTHRRATAASGFGSRMTADLPAPRKPDALTAPVLLQVGSTVLALDPISHAAIELSPATVAVIEELLSTDPYTRPPPRERQVRDAVDELVVGGIARHWCDVAWGKWVDR